MTVSVPPAAGKAATEFSVKLKVAVPADVPPSGTVPALVTLVEANAAGAIAVAKREASSVAERPILPTFFAMFKESSSLRNE